MDTLVKSYLRRHEDMLRGGISPSTAKQQEEYYSKLLLGHGVNDESSPKSKKFMSPSSLQTAMGRKSMVIENAYAFALRQQQVMLNNNGDNDNDNDNTATKEGASGASKIVTEQESIERVEQLLKEESRANRQRGQKVAKNVSEWRERSQTEDGEDESKTSNKGEEEDDDNDTTLPSILHDRPRAIRALNIWSARLSSIPYSRWTIGASTALDHWIAREVLQMSEQVWQQVLEGGGTDAYVVEGMDALIGGESKRGLNDRMRDIILVRGALFPETLVESSSAADARRGMLGDIDDGLLEGGSSNATEKSIDDLLASLGEFDDDDDDSAWKFDDDDDVKDDVKEDASSGGVDQDDRLPSVMDELQVWRERNASSPYAAWDIDRKDEFDQWIEKYVSILYPDANAGTIDKEATRISLLSERPIDDEKTKDMWSKVGNETDAEIFLKDYRAHAEEQLTKLWAEESLSDDNKQSVTELEAILAVPFDIQLDKLVNMGTLRPILDDYCPGKERKSFLDKYAHLFLEGLEMEHLVPDPDGPIGLDDLGDNLRGEMSKEWTPSSGLGGTGGQAPRFSIRMVAYGTDEYGTSRAERARELYSLWNEHKAKRAKFEEKLFKKGYLRLEEDGKPRFTRREQRDKEKVASDGPQKVLGPAVDDK